MKYLVAIMVCFAIALSFIAGCEEGVSNQASGSVEKAEIASDTAEVKVVKAQNEQKAVEKAEEIAEKPAEKSEEAKKQASEEAQTQVKAAEQTATCCAAEIPCAETVKCEAPKEKETAAVKPAEESAAKSAKAKTTAEKVEARHQRIKDIQAAAKAKDEQEIAKPKAEKPAAEEAAEKPEAKPEQDMEGVEVIVNGEPITTEQVRELIKPALDQIDAQLPANVREFYKQREIQKAAQGIVDQKLVEAKVKKEGIEVSDEDIEEFITKILIDNDMQRSGLEEEIAAQNLTYEQWKEQMQFEKVVAFIKLTEEEFAPRMQLEPNEVKDFYDNNTQYFDMPEQVEASHILVRTDKDADPNQSKAKAEEILSQIKGGIEFEEMAKKYTDRQGEVISESLGFFPKEKMVEGFSNAAFAMKVGQVSDEPVQTRFGYHIIKVTGHKDPEKISFEEAKKKITNFLTIQKRQELEKEYKAKLREGADIVYPPGKEPKPQGLNMQQMMRGMGQPAPNQNR